MMAPHCPFILNVLSKEVAPAMPASLPPPVPILTPAAPVAFDLARLAPSKARCGEPAADGAIVVCAVDREKFRVHGLAGPFADPAPPMARLSLAPGITAFAEGEQRGLGGGVSVPAAMVRLKFKF